MAYHFNKLLVFSDNRETQSTYIAFGSCNNYMVQFFEKNSTSVRNMIEHKYDLIIIEIMKQAIPEVMFFEQVYNVSKGTPIIIVSEFFFDNRKIVFGNKIAGYILKPLKLDNLLDLNKSIFASKEIKTAKPENL